MGGFTVVTPIGAELGRNARLRISRSAQAELVFDGRDPVALLTAGDEIRRPELLRPRYERMATSPSAFFRGAAAIMAHDLAASPHSGLFVQAVGDAHVFNIGVFATPDRGVVADVGDFDETLEAPFEWDVKRLAASVLLVGREAHLPSRDATAAVGAAVVGYREAMLGHAAERATDVWYSQVGADETLRLLRSRTAGPSRQVARAAATKARHHDQARTLVPPATSARLATLTRRVDGALRLREDPPLLTRAPADDELLRHCLREYRQTLAPDRRVLLDRYAFADHARTTAGVGAVGFPSWVVLLTASPTDALLLQVRQAGPSALEWHLTPSPYRYAAQRVVEGQRLIQAVHDPLLGWYHPRTEQHGFVVRQLREVRGALHEVATPSGQALAGYARMCGRVLARAHARSGDPAAIAGYLGQSDRFDKALVRFATAYAERTEADHATLLDAVTAGQLPRPVAPPPVRRPHLFRVTGSA